MRLQPIVEQLADCGFVHVAGVLEWAALRTAPGRLPAAFIVPTSETASDNRNDHGVDQRVSDEFMVALVLNAAARVGAVVDDQLDDLSKATKLKLVGWKHPEASAPTLFSGASLLSADGYTLAWGLRFKTAYHLRTR